MIESDKIMIGNFVLNGDNSVVDVESIVEDGINYELDYSELWTNPEYHFENLQPIPIDDDWLMNDFRCIRIDECTYGMVLDPHTTLLITYAEGKYYFNLRRYNGSLIKEIKLPYDPQYIHELQLLHLALTGKILKRDDNK